MEFKPRLLRAVPNPLGAYFRATRADHKTLTEFLSAGAPLGFKGVVLDAGLDELHRDLRREARDRHVEAILDTRTLELATPEGFAMCAPRRLPWAGDRQHEPDSLRGDRGLAYASEIARWLAARDLSGTLAPTHFLARGGSDPWADVDRELTIAFRRALDRAGLSEMPIYYPLAVPSDVFFDAMKREQLRVHLSGLPIDALWLRIHPFGSRSGPQALRRYLAACTGFHSLGKPVVAEKTGTIGLALLAFGAVGGIESGLTLGEQFDASSLFKHRDGGAPFSPPPRVYVTELRSFLSRKDATKLFANRSARALFGCNDDSCCPRGSDDTLKNPKPHFLRQRLSEVSRLSGLPESLRASRYMEEILRHASDRILRAISILPMLEKQRHRLETWREVLGDILQETPPVSFAAVPDGRRVQVSQPA